MRKRAQMQMTETIFVVFIILIIIMLGFVFYSKFQEISIKEKEKILRNIEVIKLAHRISSWPELECSVAGAERFACLDMVKLEVLGDFINRTMKTNSYGFNYYYDLLKNSKITITEVYPSSTKTLGTDYWLLYDNPGSTPLTDAVIIPVNLYNPVSKTYALGMMEVQIFK
jgi:hypothetical protein